MDAWDIILSKIAKFKIKRGITSFVNPYSMLLLEQEKYIAEKVDYWYVDGTSLIIILKLFFKKKCTRQSFDETSIAPSVFHFAKENQLKIAIVGTKEEYIKNAVNNIEDKHDINVTYYRNGYFNSEEELNECYKIILSKEIDIVICGMGTPYQEQFLIGLVNKGWEGYGFTCGGFLHQSEKKANYYPNFFNKLNLRWVYRIIDEPKLIKRYTMYYSIFIYRFLVKRKRIL